MLFSSNTADVSSPQQLLALLLRDLSLPQNSPPSYFAWLFFFNSRPHLSLFLARCPTPFWDFFLNRQTTKTTGMLRISLQMAHSSRAFPSPPFMSFGTRVRHASHAFQAFHTALLCGFHVYDAPLPLADNAQRTGHDSTSHRQCCVTKRVCVRTGGKSEGENAKGSAGKRVEGNVTASVIRCGGTETHRLRCRFLAVSGGGSCSTTQFSFHN